MESKETQNLMKKIPYQTFLLWSILLSGMYIHVPTVWNGWSVEAILIAVILGITFLLAAVQRKKDVLLIQSKKDKITLWVQYFLVWEFIALLYQVGRRLLYQEGDITALSIVCILITVILLQRNYRLDEEGLQALFVCGVIVSLVCIWDSMVEGETLFYFWSRIRLQDDIATAVILFFLIIGTYGYLFYEKERLGKLYIAGLCIGMFALNLQNCYLGRILAFFILGLFPIVYLPTARLLQRTCIVLGCYLMICSNTGLITDYSTWFRKSYAFPIEGTIILDIFLCLAYFVFDYYWRKLPANEDIAGFIYRKLYRAYVLIYSFLIAITLGMLFNGQQMLGMPDRWWNKGMKQILGLVVGELSSNATGLQTFLVQHDIVTILGGLVIGWLLVASIWKNRSYGYSYRTLGMIVFISFAVGSLLLEYDSTGCLLYVAFGILAMYGEEEKSEYTIVRRKIEHEVE